MARGTLLSVAAISIAATLSGCDSGPRRHALSGTVTYQDQPVPSGKISFRPDRSRGGTGPAGYAPIVDGKFSTKQTGKGAVPGPIEIAIVGYTSKEAYSPALFPPYKTTAEITDDNDSLDIEVPETEAPEWFKKMQKRPRSKPQ